MTFTLCMIVKDEEPRIERALMSAVKAGVDSWCIVDTGSTDGTMDVVRRVMAEVELVGELHQRPFVDFGTNRTDLLQLAARQERDHLVLLDADQELVGDLLHVPEGLDALRIKQIHGSLAWWNPLLLRNRGVWRFVGRTHEYLEVEGRAVGTAEGLSIIHHGDGASRPEKHRRDLELLRRDLADDPDNVRVMFYLAQTLDEMGRGHEAIHWYDRRAKRHDGWDAERWMAQYRAALLASRCDWAEGQRRLWEAWDARPARSEPLHHLAGRFLERGEWNLAYLAASQATTVQPEDLFVETWVYEYGIDVVRSLAAWRTGRVGEAKMVFERLAQDPSVPQAERDAANRNLMFCPEGEDDGC